jgi:SPW repeat
MTQSSPISQSRPTWRSESVLDVYNLCFAAFLFASPWLFAFASRNGKLDDWISSAAVAAIAIAAIVGYANWKEWLNILLGAWLIVSPWVLGFAHTKAMHFSIATGILVAFMATIELILVNFPPETSTP